jgi:hypothetical protein
VIAGLIVLLTLAVTLRMPVSLAGTDDALAVFGNPAGLAERPGSESLAVYSLRPVLWRGSFCNTPFIAKAGPSDLRPPEVYVTAVHVRINDFRRYGIAVSTSTGSSASMNVPLRGGDREGNG